MDRRYNYHDKEKDKQFNISSMTKYLEEKHEIDKELEKIITPYIESKKLRILDACCGVGHISHFLSKISPQSEFLGIDYQITRIFGLKLEISMICHKNMRKILTSVFVGKLYHGYPITMK